MQNKLISLVLAGIVLTPAAALAAAPIVPQGVGVRVTTNGLNFVSRELAGKDINLQKANVNKPNIFCYDQGVGFNNLVVSAHVNSSAFAWHANDQGLSVQVKLDTFDMAGQLYGNSSALLCPNFTQQINKLELTNVVFTAEVTPHVDSSYHLTATIDQPPQVSYGGMSVNMSGFAGWLVNLLSSASFAQGFVQEELNELLAEKAPDLVKNAVFTAMFSGYYGPYAYAIGASALSVDAGGGDALFDVQVGYTGTPASCVPPNAPQPTFPVAGTPGLGAYGDTSMLEVSLADAAVNEVLWSAWRGGMLCYDDATHPLAAFQHLLEGLSPQAGQLLHYSISVSSPPTVTFTDTDIQAAINGFHLEAYALEPNSGSQQLLLQADADLSVGVKPDVDPTTNQLLVSLDSTQVTVNTIDSQILFSSDPNAEQDLKNFIQGYVVQRLTAQIQNKAVSPTLLDAAGYLILLDELHPRLGHLVLGTSVYDPNDPAVDHTPPTTSILTHLGTVSTLTTDVDYAATDDAGSGTLLYSWQLDDNGWTSWSADTTAHLAALTDGPHTFSVRSRDKWMNVDPNPPQMSFTVAAQSPSGSGNGLLGFCDVGDLGGPMPFGAAVSLGLAAALGMSTIRRRAG